MNTVQETVICLLAIKIIYTCRNWFHWHGSYIGREVIIPSGQVNFLMSLTFLVLTSATQRKTFRSKVELWFTITISLCGFSTWLFVAGLHGVVVWLSCCLEHWQAEGTSKYWWSCFCSKVVHDQVPVWKILSWLIFFRVWILELYGYLYALRV